MCTVSSLSADVRDRDWVAARLDAGDTVTAIADQAGVSRQTASSWLKRHGLTATKKPLDRPSAEQMAADYERIGSIRPMATEYNISAAVMRTWLFEAGVETNDARSTAGRPRRVVVDVKAVNALRAEGQTWHDIGEQLGVSSETARRAVMKQSTP